MGFALFMKKTLTEKRFFEWHEDDVSVTLRNKGGSYGGGSEVLVIYECERKGKNMLHITFEYMDAYSNGKWNRQECTVSSVDKCIELYGLGKDCDYRIISVEDVSCEDSFHDVG